MKDFKAELNRVSLINKCARMSLPETDPLYIKPSSDWDKIISTIWDPKMFPLASTDGLKNKNKQIERLTHEGPAVTPAYLNTKILYTFGENCFREYPNYKPENSCKLFTFGCSFTFGVSIPDEHTWPYLLANKLGKWNLKNYGVGGAGVDTIARLCYQTINTLKKEDYPDLVVFDFPMIFRKEYVGNINDNLITKLTTFNSSKEFDIKAAINGRYKYVDYHDDPKSKDIQYYDYTSCMHSFYEMVTAFTLIKETLESRNIKWMWYIWDGTFFKLKKETIEKFFTSNTMLEDEGLKIIKVRKDDRARDGTHAGLSYMNELAEAYYNLYKTYDFNKKLI